MARKTTAQRNAAKRRKAIIALAEQVRHDLDLIEQVLNGHDDRGIQPSWLNRRKDPVVLGPVGRVPFPPGELD